ncbi:S8 family serine peptidase [Tahibacter sp. UC22_41]|uniref:S8 family serine peptidase n=1 Tax=Tahibacter sp. UC22_41 TaxID=3350178 RepID=UPI0036DA5D91
MALIDRKTVLASLIAAGLAAGSVTTATAADDAPVYLVRFTEPGVLGYRGGVGALKPTAPNRAAGRRFDVHAADVAAYRGWLADAQTRHESDIAARLGRTPALRHRYQMTHSGFALVLSEAEAAAVAALPGVASVEPEPHYALATYRGPSFIGAAAVWNTTPTAPARRGRGAVIGVMDGGSNSTHPSFANDASCGFSAADPKLLSFRDCMTSENGVCNSTMPEDYAGGHGVHTSSTAAGNTLTLSSLPAPVLPAPFTQMSGVAPCASVRSYKVCDSTTCNGSAILAAIDNIVVDGDVDVVNYSISGGTQPWSDTDREFLDLVNTGIFVAAAAGNTTTQQPDPVGKVNHLGPWVATVAAVTHDAANLPALSVTAPTQPVNLTSIAMHSGDTTPAASPMNGVPLKSYPANPIGCTADGGIAANALQGAIAVLRRGTCTFGEKITNAYNAGAVAVVIGNNQAGALSMDTTGAANIPSYSISSQAVSDALIAYANANNTAAAALDPTHHQGDRLGDFSQRGPTPDYYRGLTKPDISAPGVDIYAAQTTANGSYGYMSGTSMASPHVAGAALLVRAAHPDWSPMAVKSALQLTARHAGFQEDGTSAAIVDQVGSGLVDVAAAVDAGLVMEESYDNFVAANPSTHAVDLKALNLPSLRNMNCTPSCTFTRTVTSTLASASTWTATFASNGPGVTAQVEPATFTIPAGGSQTFTVTIRLGIGDAFRSVVSGALILTESASQAPPARLSVNLIGSRPRDQIFDDGLEPVDTTHIVAHDNLNFVFPATSTGGAVNWQTGALCNQTNQCFYGNYHFNMWLYTNAEGSMMGINHPLKEPREDFGSVVLPGTLTFLVMQRGEVVGPDSTFTAVSPPSSAELWRQPNGVDGYVGFRFRNTVTNQINYGYARFATQGPTGLPATLVSYRYDDSGAPITIR